MTQETAVVAAVIVTVILATRQVVKAPKSIIDVDACVTTCCRDVPIPITHWLFAVKWIVSLAYVHGETKNNALTVGFAVRAACIVV